MPERPWYRLSLGEASVLFLAISALVQILIATTSDPSPFSSRLPWWGSFAFVGLPLIMVAVFVPLGRRWQFKDLSGRIGSDDQARQLLAAVKLEGDLPERIDPDRWYRELYRRRNGFAPRLSLLSYTLLGPVLVQFLTFAAPDVRARWIWSLVAASLVVGLLVAVPLSRRAGRRLAHVDRLLWQIIERERAGA